MKAGYMVKHFVGTFLFFAIIFVCAGRLNFLPGLVYVSLGIIMSVVNYTVLKIDPELLDERSKPGDGTKSWDKMILGFSFLLTLTMYAIAGLDSGRYHASRVLPMSTMLTGVVLTATGQLLFLIAQKQNKFFSSTVRIQTNRNHTVCDTGLYKFVRHPAYLGAIIQAAGFPLLFGSLWSIIPVALLVTLFLIRTYLEDITLQKELEGYREYSTRTPFRVFPYIW